MTIPTVTYVKTPPSPLPYAGRVLAVTARPGQESADLGGLLFAFRRSGASLGPGISPGASLPARPGHPEIRDQKLQRGVADGPS